VNFRLPLFVMAAAFGVCVLFGGTMVRIGEKRTSGVGPSMDRTGNVAAG
jgi:hypothetical protein